MLSPYQKTLFDDVAGYFEDQSERHYVRCQQDHTIGKDHGRIEERIVYSAEASEAGLLQQSVWKKLRTLVMIESKVIKEEQTTITNRYYISSLPHDDVKRLHECIRGHWSIENSLHWILDVVFDEDHSRVRTKNADANFAFIRKFALSLLKNTPSKGSIKRKRLRAGWDENFLRTVIRSN